VIDGQRSPMAARPATGRKKKKNIEKKI